MKYLKTYENKSLSSIVNKKFIVIKSFRTDIPYYILKTEKTENDKLIYLEYYYINNGKLKKHKNDDIDSITSIVDMKDTVKELIFQTDNIKKAIEILYLQNDINKYNL